MIFKVYYQETKVRNPKREQTQSLYIEADNDVIARQLVEDNTPYNIELVQSLEGNHLDYEKENADFTLTEFN
ncbi:DNA-directed RNA polymerase subunit epsilon [uncultured Vagococcus sp.]|uniref:DNA-directed RNA polymerase subunit epsilon n=1 Tax=uncultured Vagococcus sp. TaxID=189676 RepID=UPI0028D3C8BE|nr:DNA-directed RNA polymerase subunit epsilon [uncultured Vagococcus sp.]